MIYEGEALAPYRVVDENGQEVGCSVLVDVPGITAWVLRSDPGDDPLEPVNAHVFWFRATDIAGIEADDRCEILWVESNEA